MGRNVEIKARVRDRADLERRAAALADGPPVELRQDDTFFDCPRGRLKLRVLAPDLGELISYERADEAGPKASRYHIARTARPVELLTTLQAALAVCGRVIKQRRVYMVGQTRVHLDRVEGLGDYMELEVVLTEGQAVDDGRRLATRLMQQLGVAEADLVRGAYIDLLSSAGGCR